MVILAQSKNVMLTPNLIHSKFYETQYGQQPLSSPNTPFSSLWGEFLATFFTTSFVFLLTFPLPL